jgi:serine/threonine protein kinase
MRVKHKDLKPASILVMTDGQLLIADFGLSKDLIDEETTASVKDAERRGTPMYWAPEIDPVREIDPSHRGRAADIYALGCIFLEIATIFIAPPGSRAEFAQYRATEGSREYRRSPEKILRWIWYLVCLWEQCHVAHKKKITDDSFNTSGGAVGDLAFLMLDPNPNKRITARQMVTLISIQTTETYFRFAIKKKACPPCSEGVYVDVRNLPLHSVFKYTSELEFPKIPGEALTTRSLPDWESAKKQWLLQHMWW